MAVVPDFAEIKPSFRGAQKREPQMRNCASGNLEIPGLVLRTIPE
jgi:hypothetical protein